MRAGPDLGHHNAFPARTKRAERAPRPSAAELSPVSLEAPSPRPRSGAAVCPRAALPLPPEPVPRPPVRRGERGAREPGGRAGATHPTSELAAGSCRRCASTARCAAATGPRAAADPWQSPPLRIDRARGGGRRLPRPRRASRRARSGPRAGGRADVRASGDARRPASGGPGGRRRPPAAEGGCAGGRLRPGRARAECRRPGRASESLDFTRCWRGTGNSSPTAGQDRPPPESSLPLFGFQSSPSRSCQSRPLDQPFGALWRALGCPSPPPPTPLRSSSLPGFSQERLRTRGPQSN